MNPPSEPTWEKFVAQRREVRHYMAIPDGMPYEELMGWSGKPKKGQWKETRRNYPLDDLEELYPASEGWRIVNHTIVQLGGDDPAPPVLSILVERLVGETDPTLFE